MASTTASSHHVWPLHGGETGALIRSRDWSATPLGDAAQWPERFRATVDICLDAAFACFVWWGPELVQIYNDAALPIVQARHPSAFGVPARDAWPAVWPSVAPIVARVMSSGRSVRRASMSLPKPDAGGAIGFSCSALRDTAGDAAGVFVTAFDINRYAWPRLHGPRRLEAMDGHPSPAFDIFRSERCEDVLQRDNLPNSPDLVMREAGETLRWVPVASFPLAKSDDSDHDAPSIVPNSAKADFAAEDSGHLSRSRGVARDAAGESAAAERMAMMVAELQHRTRNLIAVVRAIISRTLVTSPSPDVFWRRIDDRLRALSRVQGLLSRAGQEPITIGALVRLEFEEGDVNESDVDGENAIRGGARRERVHVAGPAVPLRNSIVETLALALHELAANARAYGALSVRDGRLRIGWWLEQRGRRSWLMLNWVEETDRRAVAPPVRQGYGRAFIEHALSYSHGAETRYELYETGLWCSIALPLGPDGSEGGRS
jgi:two-component system CheB/CheR fusion protein